MMIVLGESRIQAGVQPLKSQVRPSFLNACEMTERVCAGELASVREELGMRETYGLVRRRVHYLRGGS